MPESTATPHEPRLRRELRALLQSQRVASLGTLTEDATPFVSMVPFALAPSLGGLVIHVSGLAIHTPNLLARPQVALMVMQAEQVGQPVHALPRVSLEGRAQLLEPGSAAALGAREVYLGRFPEAEMMTELPDFRFVLITPLQARQVAGFGAARSLDADELRALFGSAPELP